MRRHGQLVERRQIEEIAEALDGQDSSTARASRTAAPSSTPAFSLRRPVRPPTRAAPTRRTPTSSARCSTDSSRRPTGRGRSTPPASVGDRSARRDRAPHRLPPRRPGVRMGLSRAGRALPGQPLRDLRHLPRRDGAPLRPHPEGLREPARRAPVDRDFVEALAKRARQDCFGSELAHRVEHSIELQAVFLRHLFADRAGRPIVPVLASFAHEAMHRGERPDDDARVPTVSRRARRDDRGRAAACRARSPAPISPTSARASATPSPWAPGAGPHRARGRRRCSSRSRRETPQAFFESVASDGDRRRICGYSPIYAVLRSLGSATRAGQAIRPVARPQRRGVLRQRGVRVTATERRPEPRSANAPLPAEWRLPPLRVDVDGDWLDDDVDDHPRRDPRESAVAPQARRGRATSSRRASASPSRSRTSRS